jgi:N-terminal acetyltransferase B complex catalytic subunit
MGAKTLQCTYKQKQFQLNDLLIFNNVNLDVLTETYNGSFYMAYMSQWPESFLVAKSPSPSSYYSSLSSSSSPCSPNSTTNSTTSGTIMGYVLGKAEGDLKLWHGHVSAVTVVPDYR